MREKVAEEQREYKRTESQKHEYHVRASKVAVVVVVVNKTSSQPRYRSSSGNNHTSKPTPLPSRILQPCSINHKCGIFSLPFPFPSVSTSKEI